MSADNGIYILKTKDGQYRVKHTQAIENIYKNSDGDFNNLELYRYFRDCNVTKRHDTAFRIANRIYSELSIVEYGIVPIYVDNTWNEIRTYAKHEAVDQVQKVASYKLKNEVLTQNSRSVLTYYYNELNTILSELSVNEKTNENSDKKFYNIKQVLKAWKNEAHLKSNNKDMMYYEESSDSIIIYSNNPGYLIGKAGVLFDKYKSKIYELTGLNTSIKEIKHWSII